MPTVTINVSKELKESMEAHDHINWSGVARRAFMNQLSDEEIIRQFSRDSEMTEEDAIRLGRELKKRIRERIDASSG